MATKKEELKAPDPFQEYTLKLWDWVADHAKQIGVGLAGGAVAITVFAGISAHQQAVREEAGAALAKALTIAQRPISKEEPEKDASTDPDDQPFKSETDQQNALIAALNEVRTHYPDSDAAQAALLSLGDAELKLGKLDEARSNFDAYVAHAAPDDSFKALAELGQAHVAELKKDYAGAQSAYESLLRDAPHVFLKDEAALGKARMLEAQGKKNEAAEAYQLVKDGYQSADVSKTASERLAFLATQGIRPASANLAAAGGDGGLTVIPGMQTSMPMPGSAPAPSPAPAPAPAPSKPE